MDGLADRLDVGWVPEKGGVATVRTLMVGYRAVRRGICPATELARPLAGVVVPDVDLSLEVTPSFRLVPGLPWLAMLCRRGASGCIRSKGPAIARVVDATGQVRQSGHRELLIYPGMTAMPAMGTAMPCRAAGLTLWTPGYPEPSSALVGRDERPLSRCWTTWNWRGVSCRTAQGEFRLTDDAVPYRGR